MTTWKHLRVSQVQEHGQAYTLCKSRWKGECLLFGSSWVCQYQAQLQPILATKNGWLLPIRWLPTLLLDGSSPRPCTDSCPVDISVDFPPTKMMQSFGIAACWIWLVAIHLCRKQINMAVSIISDNSFWRLLHQQSCFEGLYQTSHVLPPNCKAAGIHHQ